MPPRVSVVVPMFNVATYLQDCLDSLAQQSLRDIEVVMVDDGSTDDTADIAVAMAQRDSRFRLVQQPNGGLGNARNNGAEVATGEFVAFVDSDDIVPRHAYETLLGALDKSGSDFASGNVRRMSAIGISPTSFLANVFGQRRLGTHITKFPALIADRIACNKLFRRAFWTENDLRFPEGVLYEDMPVTIPAHFLARSVDVVDRTTYLWRVREGGDLSITQQRTDLRALRDRAAAVDSVSRFLATRGLAEHKRSYDTNVLREDLRYFLDVLDAADDDYRRQFFDLANDFLDRAAPDVATPLPAMQRLKWHLARQRALPELLTVLEFEDRELDSRPPVRRGGDWYGDYPFLDDKDRAVPRDVYRLDHELVPVAAVEQLRWNDDGSLTVAGYAYVDMLGAPARKSQTITLVVEGPDGDLASLPTEPMHRPDVTAEVRSGYASLDWSGFTVTLPPWRLPATRARAGEMHLALEIAGQGLRRRTDQWQWPTPRPPKTPIKTTAWKPVRARVAADGRLEVAIVDDHASASAHRWDGGVLQVEGTLQARDRSAGRLRITRRVGTGELDYPLYLTPSGKPAEFVGRVPVADLLAEVEVADTAGHSEAQGDGVVWDVFTTTRVRRRVAMPLAMEERAWLHNGREIALQRSRFGYLSVVDRSPRPVIQQAAWTSDGELTLSGTFQAPPGDYELLLQRRRGSDERLYPFDVDGAQHRFAATVTVVGIDDPLGSSSLSQGRWEFAVRPRTGSTGGAEPVDVTLDHAALDHLPIVTTAGARTLRFGVLGYDTPLLVVGPDLRDDERGGFHQRLLEQRRYPSQRRRPIRDAVLYICHDGTSYDDNPRAIHEELVRRGNGLEHLWMVRDGRFVVPESATAVRADSSDYYDALARCRYVVANGYVPDVLRPRRGQRVLQTWHGGFVKQQGMELAGRAVARRAYLPAETQRPDAWRFLVSPSAAMTSALRRAFPFAQQVLETGSPRADLLLRPERASLGAEVRTRLGVPAGKKVLLYAPTYRDHLRQGRMRYRLGRTLDADVLRGALGEDWVVLFRRHHQAVGRLAPAGDPFIRDVSDHPSVSDLLLASDVLVTDYTSLVFDQVAMNRPVVFFTPDLEAYRDDIRGFAIPFDRVAPGPLLATTDDVVDAVRDLDLVRRDHEHAYAAFRATYCPLDDGNAAGRVVDAVFRA
ncbi:MAG TPA: CDP-glycerol glycerophosphotransferase family protein [Mycobacteriales bacterium]|nr:CDP-glycerol glycerophosphotransferase family protein [Mycobacteriales bacterium]